MISGAESRPWWRRAAPPAVILALSILFRLPAFLNAASVDSDSAIVGLQAMHILRGEFSWLLFGSGYQTSVDSLVAAAYFLVLGARPLVLMASTFVGHLIATVLAFATLRRRTSAWTAALLVLPLVFTPSPLHTYILGPPRQAALTLVFVSVWLVDGASDSRRPRLKIALGAGVASLACFADPYALLFLPALALMAAMACFDGARRGLDDTVAMRSLDREQANDLANSLAACAFGLAAGLLPLVLLWLSPAAVRGETTLTAAVVRHNGALLIGACLPWVLSARAYYPHGNAYVPWEPGLLFRVVEIAGACTLVAGISFGGAAILWRSLDWKVRRLGFMGFAVFVLSMVGFLMSTMVMDLFSTRYLASIVLMAPFALAPAASYLRARRFGLALAPYLASAAVAGWIGFGSFVDGAAPVQSDRGSGRDEARLEALLAARGVSTGTADYWVAYRLTFLYRERILVVPVHPEEDRYHPYRDAFEASPRIAYVFDAGRSREKVASVEDQLRRHEGFAEGFDSEAERLEVGALTAFILTRAPRAR